MTSHALVVPITNATPNPSPYGALRLRKGAWDQLQANRAYQDTLHEGERSLEHKVALDLKI